MKISVILATAVFLFACAKKMLPTTEELQAKHFSFLNDSTITKEDIVLKYGEPTWVFENGRIFTYRMFITDKDVTPKVVYNNKRDQIISYNPADAMRQFSLVLVFNKDHLEKYRLINLVP